MRYLGRNTKVMLFSTERLPKETHKILRCVTTERDTKSCDKKVLLNVFRKLSIRTGWITAVFGCF